MALQDFRQKLDLMEGIVNIISKRLREESQNHTVVWVGRDLKDDPAL